MQFRLAVWMLLIFSKTSCSNKSEAILPLLTFPHDVTFFKLYLFFFKMYWQWNVAFDVGFVGSKKLQISRF